MSPPEGAEWRATGELLWIPATNQLTLARLGGATTYTMGAERAGAAAEAASTRMVKCNEYIVRQIQGDLFKLICLGLM